MSEPHNQRNRDKDEPPPTRAQRLAAFGFLGAFGLTILTVVLTGLRVGAPAARHVLQPGPPATETTAPSVRAGARSGSSNAGPAAPTASPPSVEEPSSNEKASRDGAGHDPKDGARKDSRSDTGEPQESRANDGR
ncbi:MAG TPA: hypothetical protein VMV37_09720 [Gammaproteobacteria bacterium]|nr:hypothetical protein [Gammaproteobacteria bacterium]